MSLKPISFRDLVSTQRCPEDVVELFDRRGLSHHLFADDKLAPLSLVAVVTASRPVSVTCTNSARHAGFNSMLPRRSLSGSALEPLPLD